LPFSYLNVWFNFHIQCQSTQDHCVILPPQTVQALPPSSELPFGRCNPILTSPDDNPTFTVYGGECNKYGFC
ncbi:hypothetical protein L208DRAFT_1299442, partial [Tricholoma matsutake]